VARHQVIVCDVCGQPTERIAGKISFVPSIPGVVRLNWNNYTHSADVGECCEKKIFGEINFRPRMTKGEYSKARRERSGKSTLKTKARTNAA
jgi:hypothetical protein